MDQLARRLINLPFTDTASNVPTAIFGSIGQLRQNLDRRHRVRIGLWPLICEAAPEYGLGVGTALASLLERWQDIRVYRILAPMDDDAWTIEKSQFGVDDWSIDGLDENVALWGKLEFHEGKWLLSLEVESDFLEDDEVRHFSIEALDLTGIINHLPDAAGKIAHYLESTGKILTHYADSTVMDDQLRALFHPVIEWHVNLLYYLGGKDFTENAILTQVEHLIQAGQAINDAFAAWYVSGAITYAMQPGFGELAETVADIVLKLPEAFPNSAYSSIYAATALFNIGRAEEALELLERAVEQHKSQSNVWMTLASLYQIGGRFPEAVDTIQRAIEVEAVSANLYLNYARLLAAFDSEGWELNAFILIDLDKYDDNLLLWEAAEAYGEAFRLDPEQLVVLRQQILLLIDLHAEDHRLWSAFETLVQQDKDGEYVRQVVDVFYNLNEPDSGIDILETAVILEPERLDLHVNMAVAYLNVDEVDLAVEALERAQELTDDTDALVDIQRLMLAADDPEFETRVAEIAALVSAGHSIKAEDASFLESAIEQAPLFAEGYVLLGKTYRIWDEHRDALDTLLDGHKQLPEDPDIIEVLAQVLWESDEHQLAFDYLNQGVEANPNHVPLLALTGLYLFEDDQPEDAKIYLARAEAIAPRHPTLAKVREKIAERLSSRN